jgi:hypothetical protein
VPGDSDYSTTPDFFAFDSEEGLCVAETAISPGR